MNLEKEHQSEYKFAEHYLPSWAKPGCHDEPDPLISAGLNLLSMMVALFLTAVVCIVFRYRSSIFDW